MISVMVHINNARMMQQKMQRWLVIIVHSEYWLIAANMLTNGANLMTNPSQLLVVSSRSDGSDYACWSLDLVLVPYPGILAPSLFDHLSQDRVSRF